MIIGIDLGGMSAKGAVLKDGGLLGKTRVKTSADRSAQETAFELSRLAMEVAEKAGVGFDKVQAIGIGSPGVIDSKTGTVVNWTNFNWKDVPLATYIRERTGKQVFVTNDANAAALGEAKYGAGKNYSDSVLITIGTGVGGGIILGGKLFEGYRSAGAEIGHMVIRQNGKLCSCGRRGCYEVYASARALIEITRENMQAELTSKMWEFAKTLDDVDGRTAFDALRAGDETAEKVIREFVANLGEGILNLSAILRPQAFILGGGISAEKETLLKPLRDYVYPRLYVSENYAPLDIRCAELGNDAGLYGAAQYAYDCL